MRRRGADHPGHHYTAKRVWIVVGGFNDVIKFCAVQGKGDDSTVGALANASGAVPAEISLSSPRCYPPTPVNNNYDRCTWDRLLSAMDIPPSHGGGSLPHSYDRAFLLHGPKRNEVLTLAEVQQYGLDSFLDADYVSIYGMRPKEWHSRGVRVLGRTAVECTRDALGDRIGFDVASVAKRMPRSQYMVVDPFAGSCNTLFWILRHLPSAEGIGYESDLKVFDLSHRNLIAIGQQIKLVHGDYARLLDKIAIPADRGLVVFVAPPWGTALDEVHGLNLCRTAPPIPEVIERVGHQFAASDILFAIQVYEKVSAASLNEVQMRLDWTDFRIYDINEKGRNHGILLGTRGWSPC